MIEIDLAKELVKNRVMVEKLQSEIKIAKGTIKDLSEREDQILDELGVRFSEDS